MSVDRNLYRLFIYRALDHWCANPGGGRTGKLAFVLPLGFCTGDDAADLRALFAPGGRWTIREIVDMELIWRSVFDARVLPMILIAEARPPRPDDCVTVHLADERCVQVPAVKGGRPTFDLDRAAVSMVAYADLFAPDGRILTRMTPERLAIIGKLRACATLNDAAKRYWTRQRKGGIDVTDQRPSGIGVARWEEQRLIRYGLAQRGRGTTSDRGLPLWKGENIRSSGLAGSPAFERVDVGSVSSPSVWAYPDILPQTMYALPLIEQTACAAPFDPARAAMLNTVVVFGPRADLAMFPFDALLLSRMFGYYSILNLRSSYLDKLRSHIYPSVVDALPWSEALVGCADPLLAARVALFDACHRRYDAGTSLRAEAASLGLRPLRDVFRTLAPGATLLMSETVAEGEPFTVAEVAVVETPEGWAVVPDTAAEGTTVMVPSEALAELIAAGLRLAAGTELTRTTLLRLPVPLDAETAARLTDLSARYATDVLEDAVEREVDRIDAIVGPALGLDAADIAFIQHEMAHDPFLGRIRPRYPFFTPKQRGRRTTLERSDRYRATRGGAE